MVVYVYHNTVDATGDYAPTEGKTFEAVRKAIDEIASLVGHIVNNLNGSQVRHHGGSRLPVPGVRA